MNAAEKKMLLCKAYLLYEFKEEKLRNFTEESTAFNMASHLLNFALFEHLLDKMMYGEEVSFCEALEEVADQIKEESSNLVVRVWALINAINDTNRLRKIQMEFLERFAKKTNTLNQFQRIQAS